MQIYQFNFNLMFAILKCLTRILIYSDVSVKHNKTLLCLLFVLGQHVLIRMESSSGCSNEIDPCLEMFKMCCGISNAYILDKCT